MWGCGYNLHTLEAREHAVRKVQDKEPESNLMSGSDTMTNELNKEAKDCFILNPESTFPLTLYCATSIAKKIKSSMEKNKDKGPSTAADAVFRILARERIKCKEVMDYINTYGPIYRQNLNRAKVEINYETLPEQEQLDTYPLIQDKALKNLQVATDASAMLFEYDTNDEYSINFALEGYDADLLETYFEYKKKKTSLFKVAAKSRPHLNNRFKRMVKLNIAEEVSSEGQFRLLPLPATFTPIAIQKIQRALAYYRDVAYLLSTTFLFSNDLSMWDDTLRMGIIKGWKVSCIGDNRTCEYCKKEGEKIFPTEAPPKLPLHLGCRCVLIPET